MGPQQSLVGRRQSTTLFRALREQHITVTLAVPQALQLFMEAIEREVHKQGKEASWRRLQCLSRYLPPSVRRLLFRSVHQRLGGKIAFFVSGGASLDPALEKRWELLGIPIVQGYGATETAPVITATSLGHPVAGSVGKAVPGVQLKIAPDGEVLVRGPNVTPGYWQDAAATRAAFAGGWYRTGDLGELDAEGNLFLRGRKNNLIVLPNGQNVFPEDIEQVLGSIEGVREVVVLGLRDPRGMRLHAVLLADPALPDPATVIRQANGRLAPHQQIGSWSVWPDQDFPRTHTLKVKRGEIREAVVAATEVSREQPTAPEDREASPLRRLIATAADVPVSRITQSTTLGDELGLDSLRRVERLAAIEADLGIYLDETQIGPATTVADLESLTAVQRDFARPEFPTWPLSRPVQWLRSALQRLLFAALNSLAPATVSGTANLSELGPPVLFVANHSSHLDSPAVLRALPAGWRRRVTVAAAADYFFCRRSLGALVALLLNAFPFSRTGAVRPTLEHCATLLDGGWSTLLYPEATRSTDTRLGEFKAEVGLLAVDLQVPVVPIWIEGTGRVLPKGKILPRRSPLSVRFGAPLRFEETTPCEAATRQIEEAVRRLFPRDESSHPLSNGGGR